MGAVKLSRRAALAGAAVLPLSGRVWASAKTGPRVRTGLDRVLADPASLKGKRIGLLTHDAAVASNGQRGVDALAALPGITLAALFAPEHGLSGAAAAGEHVGDMRDGRTGLPVFSLYGKRPAPEPAQLAGLDLLVSLRRCADQRHRRAELPRLRHRRRSGLGAAAAGSG